MKLLFILFVLFTIIVMADKQLVNKLTTIKKEWIAELKCLDSNNCYAISDFLRLTGDEDFVHSDIYIYKSTDQGDTWKLDWETYYIPGKDSVASLGKAFILDSNHFYFTFLERMIVDMTSDGGKTFKRVTFGEFSLDEKYIIRKIGMYDKNIGVIIFNHGILSTQNSWETYDFYAYQGSRKSSDVLFFLDSNNVLIQSGLHINSFDIFNIPNQTRAKYSEPIESPPGEEEKLLYNIEIVTDSLFYATGGQKYGANEAGKDIIYRTTDRGRNWEIIYEHIKEHTFSCTQIAFRNEYHGIAAGSWDKFMETFDGGYTWNYYEELPIGVSHSIGKRVAFAGSYPLLSSLEGGIYRVEEVTSVSEPKSSGISIVPNPAGEYIEIGIDGAHLEGGLHLNIEIYDVLGNVVISTEDNALRQAQQPRSRSAEVGNGGSFSGYFDYAQQPLRIDISHLPKGVYFVRIGDKVEKFVKM